MAIPTMSEHHLNYQKKLVVMVKLKYTHNSQTQ